MTEELKRILLDKMNNSSTEHDGALGPRHLKGTKPGGKKLHLKLQIFLECIELSDIFIICIGNLL